MSSQDVQNLVLLQHESTPNRVQSVTTGLTALFPLSGGKKDPAVGVRKQGWRWGACLFFRKIWINYKFHLQDSKTVINSRKLFKVDCLKKTKKQK